MTGTPADTIAAVATPPGRGGVGIVRVSGPAARWIAEAMLGALPPARRVVRAAFQGADGEAIDDGLAVFFHAPASFTGEDVLELHGHGGTVICALTLARVIELGARHAEPGEFSLRAFLNDRIDLAQAEAIADLVDSGSVQAARAAVRSLRGAFSDRVRTLAEEVHALRVYVEAAIDFPEEEIDFLADGDLDTRLDNLLGHFDALETVTQQGRLLRDGLTVVIAGRPNAGKSSLLNLLAGYDAAIVTAIPGTTRDVLRETIEIDGLPLNVVDTAGLRVTTDAVEREGVRRARVAIESADRVLFVHDDTDSTTDIGRENLPDGVPVTIVRNKIDLSGREPGLSPTTDPPSVAVCALTGAGVDALREHLKTVAGFAGTDSGSILARERHVDCFRRARKHVDAAVDQLRTARAGELVAEELRLAQQALGEITGAVSVDDLLGSIFSSFCIGK